MQGYFALTDHGWWRHLSETSSPREANFWRPSARAVRLPVGTPFFFKLKAPHRAICGFGSFAGFTILPDWMAWETFGDGNGVTSLAALRSRLTRIRDGSGIARDSAGRIGCCLIAEAQFFSEGAWVEPPSDWGRGIQSGKRMELLAGEGARVWAECLERVNRDAPAVAAAETTARYGGPALRAPRLGQGIFRVRVLDAYGYACAVTHEHSLPVLDAAHIQPFAEGGPHRISNGMALRADIHRLFDRGYVTVGESNELVVGDRLKEDFDNGRSYYKLKGQRLTLPSDPALRPDAEALRWHREVRFLG